MWRWGRPWMRSAAQPILWLPTLRKLTSGSSEQFRGIRCSSWAVGRQQGCRCAEAYILARRPAILSLSISTNEVSTQSAWATSIEDTIPAYRANGSRQESRYVPHGRSPCLAMTVSICTYNHARSKAPAQRMKVSWPKANDHTKRASITESMHGC